MVRRHVLSHSAPISWKVVPTRVRPVSSPILPQSRNAGTMWRVRRDVASLRREYTKSIPDRLRAVVRRVGSQRHIHPMLRWLPATAALLSSSPISAVQFLQPILAPALGHALVRCTVDQTPTNQVNPRLQQNITH